MRSIIQKGLFLPAALRDGNIHRADYVKAIGWKH